MIFATLSTKVLSIGIVSASDFLLFLNLCIVFARNLKRLILIILKFIEPLKAAFIRFSGCFSVILLSPVRTSIASSTFLASPSISEGFF